MIKDRRKGKDRRKVKRVEVKIEIEWESPSGRQTGTISDISAEGCFVLSSGEVADGDHVKLFMPISDGMKIQFEGEVVNHVFEIGFGMIFSDLNLAQRDLLKQIISTEMP